MAGTITITGHLTRDPETETVQVDGEDRLLCRFSVGYSIHRGNNSGNFIDVTTWGKAAANHAKWLAKGKPVRVDGELDHQTWEAEDGTKRSRHSISNASVEYLGSPSDSSSSNGSQAEPVMAGGEPF